MVRMRWMVAAALALTGSLTACSDDAQDDGATRAGTTAQPSMVTADDPLAGRWTAVLTPELEEQAAVAAGLEPDLLTNEQLFGGAAPITVVLRFEDGQMVHTSAPEGAEPDVGWSGAYEIVDEDTFVAGDTGDLYIEYTYSIDGDRLVIDMVKNDYPTVSEVELAGEIYAQTVIYESAPFVREA